MSGLIVIFYCLLIGLLGLFLLTFANNLILDFILDVCRSALDPGPCNDAIPKVFYNATNDQCEPFTYSGCLGGPNHFADYDECESVCRPLSSTCYPGNGFVLLVRCILLVPKVLNRLLQILPTYVPGTIKLSFQFFLFC